jgi:hypothetical protein
VGFGDKRFEHRSRCPHIDKKEKPSDLEKLFAMLAKQSLCPEGFLETLRGWMSALECGDDADDREVNKNSK